MQIERFEVRKSIFQKRSGEGLTEPLPQTPPPALSWALLSNLCTLDLGLDQFRTPTFDPCYAQLDTE